MWRLFVTCSGPCLFGSLVYRPRQHSRATTPAPSCITVYAISIRVALGHAHHCQLGIQAFMICLILELRLCDAAKVYQEAVPHVVCLLLSVV